jgi:putative transposase
MIQRLRKDYYLLLNYEKMAKFLFVLLEMYRSNPWTSDWLKRCDKEGIEGLKDRTKSGRSLGMSEEISLSIKKELQESKQGRSTKHVEELIIKKSGINYHYTHIYHILRK